MSSFFEIYLKEPNIILIKKADSIESASKINPAKLWLNTVVAFWSFRLTTTACRSFRCLCSATFATTCLCVRLFHQYITFLDFIADCSNRVDQLFFICLFIVIFNSCMTTFWTHICDFTPSIFNKAVWIDLTDCSPFTPETLIFVSTSHANTA